MGSFDPIYPFSKEDIEKRIEEVRITVMQQMKENRNNSGAAIFVVYDYPYRKEEL